jgi:ATP synthase mitochondrial F1 complex assembly factor 2
MFAYATIRKGVVCSDTIMHRFCSAAAKSARRALSTQSVIPPQPPKTNLIGGRKRFYKNIDVEHFPAEEAGEGDLYGILLDGRRLKTVQMNHFLVPSEDLAWAIASEWDAQTDNRRGLQPATMPLMTLASIAIDQTSVDPTLARETVLKFLPTDSALFFTNDLDRILLANQKEHLQPVVDFLNRELGTEIQTTTQLTGRIQHPEDTVRVVHSLVHALDPHTLACLQLACSECKSVVLGMAYVLYGHIGLEALRYSSRLEEEFQVDIWGVVEGGHDMDRLNNAVNLSAIGLYMSLLRSHAAKR